MEQQTEKTLSISDIRTVLQEELKAACFVSAGTKTDTDNEEEIAQNVQNILEDLKLFDWAIMAQKSISQIMVWCLYGTTVIVLPLYTIIEMCRE